MNTNIRRFAAAITLTVILGITPAIAAAPRDGADRERAPIVRIVKRILQRFLGVTPSAEPTMPVPAPSNTNINP